MGLTIEQREAVKAPTSVAVTAGAGTGKTRMLAERYLFHLEEQNHSPIEVVAITFTNLAADELRSRIRKTVIEKFPAGEQRDDIIAELEAAQISTIHALCARICRDHPEESGAPHGFEVIEDSEDGIIVTEWLSGALDSMPEEIYEVIPFSLLRLLLSALLGDPVTAREALERGPDDWRKIAAKALSELRNDLVSWPEYERALVTVRSYRGQSDDRMEINRQTALEASKLIDAGGDALISGIEMLSEMKFNAGSAKRWPDGGFPEVKSALTALRDRAKDQLGYAVYLRFGPLDEQFAAMLPALKKGFEHASGQIRGSKIRARLLDYNDLEDCALRALDDESVREYYKSRWKAFLVDEFQDTNQVQARIIELLTRDSKLTIVGDEKQSIYRFRRAEVEVFRKVKAKINNEGGLHSALSLSFRSHVELIGKFNPIFDFLLGELHQPLEADRKSVPHEGPHVRLCAVRSEKGVSVEACRRTEARKIASLVKEMIGSGMMVHDDGRLRPVGPGDMAVLSRAWKSLDVINEALASEGIRAINMGGGNLLETREAKDAMMMLRFLADPTDDLALVAVLRSPFFAISDRTLFDCAQSTDRNQSWWARLSSASGNELERPAGVLKSLIRQRAALKPSGLLRLADRLTGYSAVIANLPNSMRREADWTGMIELIRSFEAGSGEDLFATNRRLREYLTSGIEVPQPKIEARDAVSLMSIHAAKGLEWPVVIIPDLSRRLSTNNGSVLFDPHRGIGVRFSNEDDESEKTMLYSILQREQKQKDQDEARRLLYVAITRARDSVILTAPGEEGGYLDFLLDGLSAAGIKAELVPYDPRDGLPFEQPAPSYDASGLDLMIDSVGVGLTDLRISALTDYALCPALFRFRHIDNHPGLGEGSDTARRIGRLTHMALELEIDDADRLARYEPALERKYIDEALELARLFQVSAVFEDVRKRAVGREVKMRLEVKGLKLHGSVDLLGDDYVLDYKTDREMSPEHHRFQLWAYARAAGRNKAHIAYLRQDQLHTFDEESLAGIDIEAEEMARGIVTGRFEAAPSEKVCGICPYAEICPDSLRVAGQSPS